ncbi:MAG TPA: hypothetical protein VK577_20940 [Bradyrhizobium sp.]|nr:hypothetical protein [Bradyrhizobium sp.]
MKRFILVKTALDHRFPPDVFDVPWRATWADRGGTVTIDIFFYAADITAAKQHVRDRYPGATFSDEKRDSALILADILRTAASITAATLFLTAIAVWWIIT